MIFQSTGLTAAHLTRTRTSPGPTLGIGRRVSVSTSVPPYVSYAIARMVFSVSWDMDPASPRATGISRSVSHHEGRAHPPKQGGHGRNRGSGSGSG